MMDLDLAGNVTADRIVPVEGLRWDDVSIAWTGAQFVVLERTTDAARATFLDRGGVVARSVALPCRPSRHTMLAVRADAIIASVCAGAKRLDRIDTNGSVTSTVLDSSFADAALVAAPAPSGDALLAWSFPADESLKTAILSADGTMSALRTVAQGGFGQALAPLLLAKTTGGFLLPYTVHGNLRVLKLDESGALLVTNDGPANSVGFHAAPCRSVHAATSDPLPAAMAGASCRAGTIDRTSGGPISVSASTCLARMWEPCHSRPMSATRTSVPSDAALALSIAPNASGVVVAGNGYSETHVVSFDANLQPIASRTFYGLGDVTWDGTAFVLALRERQQLTVRRLDASLRDAARARVAPLAHPDTDDSAPSVAVAVSGNAIVGVQEVEANSGARAVAYVEQELGYEPQRRRTVRR
jgi:hypothetical protein